MNTDVLNHVCFGLPDDIPPPKFKPFQEVRRKRRNCYPKFQNLPECRITLYGVNWILSDDEHPNGTWFYSDGGDFLIHEDDLEPVD